jgi:processing peptidase subunit beta
LHEQHEVDKQHEEVVFDHLHAVAYQGMPPSSESHPETLF